jgi:hypothetical protein
MTLTTDVPVTLASLLSPVSVSDFARQYWARRPLHLSGSPDRYAGLIDRAGLGEALSAGRSRVARLEPADPDLPLTAGSTETIAVDEIATSMAAGHTICITDLSAGSPFLATVADSLASELGTLGSARFNAFLSPPGSGAQLHLDARVTTSLQIEGIKEWWYAAEPAIEWPRSNAQLLPDGTPVWMYPWCGAEPWEHLAAPAPDSLTHVLLRPGDLLCLPAGTWHAARAVDESFALNLSFSPPDVPELVRRILTSAFISSPRWRGGLPPSPVGELLDRDGSQDHDGPDSLTREVLQTMLTEASDLLAQEANRLSTLPSEASPRQGRGPLPCWTDRVWAGLAGRGGRR